MRQRARVMPALSLVATALLALGCAGQNSAPSPAAPTPVAPALPQTGALSGQIIKDVNGNGRLDPGELFLVSADVSCANSEAVAGLAVGWTGAAAGNTPVTGCNATGGFFRAESLIAGNYTVSVTVPQGWTGIKTVASLTVNGGGVIVESFFLQPPAAAPPPPAPTPAPSPTPTPAPPASPVVVRTATFQGANGYSTAGTAEIVRTGSTYSLELRNDFRTSNGGILDVRLCHETGCTGGDLTLGRLEVRSGPVSYGLGGNDTSAYRYVVIYCTAINAPFGYGLLR